jgi:hypothetical protein
LAYKLKLWKCAASGASVGLLASQLVAQTLFWSPVKRPTGDLYGGVYELCLLIIAPLICTLVGTLVGLTVGFLVNKFRGPKGSSMAKGGPIDELV